jgi:hypothetical protein
MRCGDLGSFVRAAHAPQTELGSKTNIQSHDGLGLSLQDAIEAFATAAPLVKVIAHGHQHVRSSCERRRGIWMCWAGGSTYSGYGRPKCAHSAAGLSCISH